eukprot:10010255-Alexandrium_andersonii.AAC.1
MQPHGGRGPRPGCGPARAGTVRSRSRQPTWLRGGPWRITGPVGLAASAAAPDARVRRSPPGSAASKDHGDASYQQPHPL